MNKHTPYDLAQMQSLPLEAKIIMTQQRIRQWYDHWDGEVYVSFSGGKDSTVLKHIVDGMYSDVPAVFVNTGLEYPEIQSFVRDIKNGKYDCFSSNVEILRPEMRFDEVLKKYGYPVISKEVAHKIHDATTARKNGYSNSYAIRQFNGTYISKNGKRWMNVEKYKYLLKAPFNISHKCCDIMKKKPTKQYEKETGRKAFIGTMASEGLLRYNNWLRYGCNSFEKKRATSQPLSFWTEQDILHYIKKFKIPYASVYGDIVVDDDCEIEGQTNFIDILGDYEETDKLKTTRLNGTGCIFCMFGCHLEKEPNRFQRLKQTHPRQYEYCIGGGEYVTEWYELTADGKKVKIEGEPQDGKGYIFERKWQPNKEGLGLGKVLDYIGVKYD